MVATQASLFAALNVSNGTTVNSRDVSAVSQNSVNFATLVNASRPQDTSSSRRDDRRAAAAAIDTQSSSTSRIITPREAKRALDRLERNAVSQNDAPQPRVNTNSSTSRADSTLSTSASAEMKSSADSRASSSMQGSARVDVSSVAEQDSQTTAVTTKSALTTNVDVAATEVDADTNIVTPMNAATDILNAATKSDSTTSVAIAAPVLPVTATPIASANSETNATATLSGTGLLALKDQLQAIIDSDTPTTLTDLTSLLPEDDAQAAVTLFPTSTSLVDVQASADVPLVSARHILNRLNKALQAVTDVDATVMATANAAAPVINVAATSLLNAEVITAKAGDDASSDSDDAALQVQAQNDTLTVITPLAQTFLTVPTVTAEASVTTAKAAPTESVSAIDVAKPMSIEQMIPSLGLSADDKKKALPDIDLPKVSAAVETPKQPAADAASVTSIPSKFEQQLQALNAIAQPAASADANAQTNIKATAPAVNNVTALTGIGATVGVNSAIAPSAIGLTAGVINNAPIREQVQVAVRKAVVDGSDQITIQLDPLGLGRVEVKMHTTHDGQTSISFLVDKPETFDALSRDARGLERALQDSGVKADTSGMQFNLRQQAQSDTGGQRQGSQQHAQADTANGATANATVTATAATRHYRLGVQDGIDIHA